MICTKTTIYFAVICSQMFLTISARSTGNNVDLGKIVHGSTKEDPFSSGAFSPDLKDTNHSSVFTTNGKTAFAADKRKGKFFGITTTGTTGNNLQLGLSFIVPFLNIPFGASSTSSYYGSNYATTPSYGTSTSLLGLNSGSIIYAVIIGLVAIVLIPLFIYSFTGVSTSPYGRSDDIDSILTNMVSRIDDALQNQYNVDASSCLQRALCTHIASSTRRMSEGTAGSIDNIIDGFASGTYFSTLLSGTKIEEAIRQAKNGETCNKYFTKCPYSLDSLNHSLTDYAEKYVMSQANIDDQLYSFNDVSLE
ncbi:uncharacterized protein LOC116935694 [Daphnia magna]|uniref:Uncharacterized protein n=2 Tax=Daphnia magna TaxID=35525 RepID=A0ABR0B7V2_9CRUS|nr:uncharacterized protein LOC116935694 [Daphnia magna]KAK4037769.1 hypothetical protein OUZ56_029798 [Daphnia magna]KZS08398.1 putative Desiccate [Daphnia magna]